ncbi:TolC family protein [Niveibacterium sp. SC-1]|uniref:TolC family protein n=1 Tax=Niveibacterium sp. SC-1 TaxID=3135646 RepID=UPI00311DF496
MMFDVARPPSLATEPAHPLRLGQRLFALGGILLLGACSLTHSKPLTQEENQQRLAADQIAMYDSQEPVSGPISFYEAAARALKYNLDYRLKLMEKALAANLWDVSTHEMLPRIVGTAGYRSRSNDSGGTSIGIEDRQVSLRPSTSEERYRQIDSLGTSWTLLDFGVAYFRTQQKSDQIYMAEERRRRVAQNVLQDVRNAYWRALGAQRLKADVDQLLVRTQKALDAAQEAEERGLLPRQEVLSYQRALLDAISLLTVRRQDLEFAQAELRALMSLPANAPMILIDGPEPALPKLVSNMNVLEQLSLTQRPEIMEEWYRKRVNQADIEIAKSQLWPNMGLDWSLQYDSNQYLYNNTWTQFGAFMSVNLLKLLQYPALDRSQESQGKTDDTRRIALSMAILTQVRLGVLRYRLACDELAFVDRSLKVDQKLLGYAQAARKTTIGSELEVIRAEGRYLLSRYQREAAYSDAQAAWGRLYNSVGLDVLPETLAKDDIATLAAAIEKTLAEQEQRGIETGITTGEPAIAMH